MYSTVITLGTEATGYVACVNILLDSELIASRPLPTQLRGQGFDEHIAHPGNAKAINAFKELMKAANIGLESGSRA